MAHPLSRELCTPQMGQAFRLNGDEYRLGEFIGAGAAGMVFEADRTRDGRAMAVKFCAPDPHHIDEDIFADVTARFNREGNRGVELHHQFLLRIEGHSENALGVAFEAKHPSNPFILMERLGALTLEGHIKSKRRHGPKAFELTRERLFIAIQLAHALRFIHSHKLVHRDVKPANIFFSRPPGDGRLPLVKLGDFGIMKWGDFHASLTTGTLTASSQKGLGTLKYMSPEQALNPKEVTPASDMFSFGVTLMELFTGEIFTSPHHVFQVMGARLERGNALSRLATIAIDIDRDDEDIASLVLDMHLRGVSRRPSAKDIIGRLEWTFESRFGGSWEDRV